MIIKRNTIYTGYAANIGNKTVFIESDHKRVCKTDALKIAVAMDIQPDNDNIAYIIRNMSAATIEKKIIIKGAFTGKKYLIIKGADFTETSDAADIPEKNYILIMKNLFHFQIKGNKNYQDKYKSVYAFNYMVARDMVAAYYERGIIDLYNVFTVNSKTFKAGIISNNIVLLAKSKYTLNFCAVLLNDNLSEKMSGVCGLGTNAFLNDYCIMRHNDPDTVCADCYACLSLNQYETLDNLSAYNHYILNRYIIPEKYLPHYNTRNDIARLECFSDLYSVRQAKNYINICRINPHITFALMTKGPEILAAAFKAMNINNPRAELSNMIKTESALYKNDLNYIPSYEWIDHVFIVCDKETAAAKGIEYTCCDGVNDRQCNVCRRCYTRDNMLTDFYVFERLR